MDSPNPDEAANVARSNRFYTPAMDVDAWFAVADRDYVELVRGVDWVRVFRGFEHPRSLLDIGCGTGRFPELLASAGGLPPESVRYDYLDPSEYSLSVLPSALGPPFTPGTAHRGTLASYAPRPDQRGAYDLIWCIHSLYTTEPDLLADAFGRLRTSLKARQGRCFVYIAEPSSFYIRFYEVVLGSAEGPPVPPFTHAGDVRSALAKAGIGFEERTLEFAHEIERANEHVLGEYLSKCAFDRRPAHAWLADEGIAPFLEGFARGPTFVFPQQVALFTWGR